VAHLSELLGAPGALHRVAAGTDVHAEGLQLQLLILGKMPDSGLLGSGSKTPYNFSGEDY